jgi:hypothetical protein
LKWIAIAITAPTLVLVATATALIAGSRPGMPGVDPAQTVRNGSREIQKPATKGDGGQLKIDAERDAITTSIDSDRASAELLEMETQALQDSLHRVIQRRLSLGRTGLGPFGGGVPADKEQRAKMQEDYERVREELEVQGDELRKAYLTKKLELASLKRRIAEASKELGQAETGLPSLGEISQRLRALEFKVDKILETVTRSPR